MNHVRPCKSVLEKLGIAEENPGAFDGEWRGGGTVIEKHFADRRQARWRASATATA